MGSALPTVRVVKLLTCPMRDMKKHANVMAPIPAMPITAIKINCPGLVQKPVVSWVWRPVKVAADVAAKMALNGGVNPPLVLEKGISSNSVDTKITIPNKATGKYGEVTDGRDGLIFVDRGRAHFARGIPKWLCDLNGRMNCFTFIASPCDPCRSRVA